MEVRFTPTQPLREDLLGEVTVKSRRASCIDILGGVIFFASFHFLFSLAFVFRFLRSLFFHVYDFMV